MVLFMIVVVCCIYAFFGSLKYYHLCTGVFQPTLYTGNACDADGLLSDSLNFGMIGAQLATQPYRRLLTLYCVVLYSG